MKKTMLSLSLLIGAIFTINAQKISDNTIGLRLGSNNGFGTEITYQRKLSKSNRLEIDLGLRNSFSDLKLTGLYQWVWNLENNFNWYSGFGGGVYDSNKTSIFASGVIGLAYHLDVDVEVPLIISLDYRPELGIVGNLNGLNSDIGLSVRYEF